VKGNPSRAREKGYYYEICHAEMAEMNHYKWESRNTIYADSELSHYSFFSAE
jgi:hypothetical protein